MKKKTRKTRRDSRMPKTLAAVILAAMLAAPAAGNAQPEPAIEVPAAPPLVIGSGDLINVSMFDAPELSDHFRVDQSGDVEMPLVKPIHVVGLTAEQAAKVIKNQYVQADILVQEVSAPTVFIEEYANQGITVSGEVKNPGVYPAFGVKMLNDVVTAAGGPTKLAQSNVIITRRSDPQHPVTLAYDPDVRPWVTPEAQIFPGDTVSVPRAGIVYVLGAVNKSGGYVLDGHDKVTVQKAVALAGGTGRAPAMNRAQLVRDQDDGTKLMITVPLDRIFKGTAPDILLRNGDILYVPTSTEKIVTQVAITAAIAVGSAIVIYKYAFH
jgi:polysaccharide export outer membrane protein